MHRELVGHPSHCFGASSGCHSITYVVMAAGSKKEGDGCELTHLEGGSDLDDLDAQL